MITFEHDKSLRELNTFGFGQRAAHYAEAADEAALEEILGHARREGWPVLVLGGGSNLVLTRDLPGLVVRLVERRVERVAGPLPGSTRVSASAGVGWHDLVLDTVARGEGGLENLSLIPGTVGAAPVQNIGAYGVELAERLHELRAYHRPSGEWRTIAAADCGFGYRDSLFKRHREDYVITRVTFDLGPQHAIVADYASLAARLAELGIETPDAGDVSRAIIDVRRARLPDPARIGNAGSFFHNPVIDADEARELRARFPDLIAYPQPDGRVKLAAGWLIDQLGFRGHRENGVGVHEHQALVLVNHGRGDGAALLALVERIVAAVHARYGVTLSCEPLIL